MISSVLNRFVDKCVEIWILDGKHIHRGILKRLEEDDPMRNVVILLSPEPAFSPCDDGDLHLATSAIYAIREVKPYDMHIKILNEPTYYP
jgi:hypothetical protein